MVFSTASVWIEAARPRTLPLSLSCIGMGSFLAAARGVFDWRICLLCCLTTIFLQILSNLANDYGDSVHGADSAERQGPQRAVQSGRITSRQMLSGMVLMGSLAFLSGVGLLFVALQHASRETFLFFLGLGLLSILAAVTYTAGKKPYGYAGLGDISVLIFFGWVGVMGTYYLYARHFDAQLLLPATSCGLFAVAVLNINNIRDIESDTRAGKKSVPVRLGRSRAVVYHEIILATGWVCAIAYVALHARSPYQWLFLLTLPLFLKNALAVMRNQQPAQLDPYLKQMAISTLLFVISFGIGQVIG